MKSELERPFAMSISTLNEQDAKSVDALPCRKECRSIKKKGLNDINEYR